MKVRNIEKESETSEPLENEISTRKFFFFFFLDVRSLLEIIIHTM